MRYALASMSILGLGLGLLAQGLSPALPYPGGYTFLRYEVRDAQGNVSTWIMEVLPQDGGYQVRISFVRTIPAQKEFSLLGAFMEGGQGMPSLAPLFSLWDKKLQAGKTYLLQGHARLVTEREDEFLGIPVVVGTYTSPIYPHQRAIVYLPHLSHRAFLLFPPYLRVEGKVGGKYRLVQEIKLVEFKHE